MLEERDRDEMRRHGPTAAPRDGTLPKEAPMTSEGKIGEQAEVTVPWNGTINISGAAECELEPHPLMERSLPASVEDPSHKR